MTTKPIKLEINKPSHVTVYNGRCLDVLQQLPDASVDLILQDPPYFNHLAQDKNRKVKENWDEDIIPIIDQYWAEWLRVTKPNSAIVFTAELNFAMKLIASQPKLFRYELIWEKNCTQTGLLAKKRPMRIHEFVLVFYRHLPIYNSVVTFPIFPFKTTGEATTNYPRSVLHCRCERGLHQTQKPVALFEWVIRTFTKDNAVVFDGFIGSGTTAIACMNAKRACIGVELTDVYYKVATQRIKEYSK